MHRPLWSHICSPIFKSNGTCHINTSIHRSAAYSDGLSLCVILRLVILVAWLGHDWDIGVGVCWRAHMGGGLV